MKVMHKLKLKLLHNYHQLKAFISFFSPGKNAFKIKAAQL